MNKSFIFDWSGTLSDNFNCFCKVCDLMFPELGREKITPEEIRKEFTLPYMSFWNKYFPELSQEKQCGMYVKYIHQVGNPNLYPGVKEVITALHGGGHKIFIASSDPESKITEEIEASGLKDFLSGYYFELQDKTEKIMELVNNTPLDINSTYYIGDTFGDVEMGKKAGVKTVGISWGFQSREGLALSKPDFLIDDILEIKNII